MSTGTTCPDSDRLLQFLEGPSPGVDDDAIVVHVEGCADCRAELDRLAAATEPSALRAVRTARPSRPDSSFLRDLKELDLRHLSDRPASPPLGEAPVPRIPGYTILGELGREQCCGGAALAWAALEFGSQQGIKFRLAA